MPIEKITSTQFEDQLRTSITDRSNAFDTAFGPVRDIIMTPVAEVLEEQNDRIRSVSLLISLINSDEFTDEDLEAFVANEGIRRIDGNQASGSLKFATPSVDPAGLDLLVPRGYPVSTSGVQNVITFVAAAPVSLPAADADSFFNVDTGEYEIEVPIIAVVGGVDGNVGTSRITTPLRPLGSTGFATITNTSPTTGGRSRETNAELIERYLLAILGRDLVTPTGVVRDAQDNFANVTDAVTVFGTDTLLTRTTDDAGAVDEYILGDELVTITESLTFVGVNQTIALGNVPLRTVLSVTQGATTFIEDIDYEVVIDTSGNQGSIRAVDGIRFISASAPPPPDTATAVSIEYQYNNLIPRLQADAATDSKFVFGRDLLYKEGQQVDIILEAQLRVNAGFSTSSVQTNVENSLNAFFDALGLGDDVEESDIQGELRRLSGIDNFIITRLVRDATATGAADVPIGKNEFAQLDTASLVITLI